VLHVDASNNAIAYCESLKPEVEIKKQDGRSRHFDFT
jgi:hypothetical protein